MQKFYMPFTTETVAKHYDYIVGKFSHGANSLAFMRHFFNFYVRDYSFLGQLFVCGN